MKSLKDTIVESIIVEALGINFDLLDIFNAKSKSEFDKMFDDLSKALIKNGEKPTFETPKFISDELNVKIKKDGKKSYILLKKAEDRSNDLNANCFKYDYTENSGNAIYFGGMRFAQILFWNDKENKVENTLYMSMSQPLGFKDIRFNPNNDELYYLPNEFESANKKLGRLRTR